MAHQECLPGKWIPIARYRACCRRLIFPTGPYRTAESSSFPYLALPPEIRNKIMRYTLVPGKVYLRNPCLGNPSLGPFTAGVFRQTSTSGFQLLATCKQIYREGIAMFYGENTFYLPPGLLKHTEVFFDEVLSTGHRNMVRHLGIRFSLDDLPLDGYHDYPPAFVVQIPPAPDIAMELWFMWTEKVNMMLSWYKSQAHAGNAVTATLHVEGLALAAGVRPDSFSMDVFEKVDNRMGYFEALLFGELHRSIGAALKILQVRMSDPSLYGGYTQSVLAWWSFRDKCTVCI